MLRHLLGLLVGLLVTPLLWVGTAWTATEIGSRIANLNFDDPLLLSATAVVMTIGVACGLLTGSRISPLAAFVPGTVMLGVSLWPLINYPSLQTAAPDWLGTDSMFHPVGPALPLNIVLGTLLFISSLAPSRWRSRPAEAAVPPALDGYGGYEPEPAWESRDDMAGAPRSGADPAEDDAAKTTVPLRRGAGTGGSRGFLGKG